MVRNRRALNPKSISISLPLPITQQPSSDLSIPKPKSHALEREVLYLLEEGRCSCGEG